MSHFLWLCFIFFRAQDLKLWSGRSPLKNFLLWLISTDFILLHHLNSFNARAAILLLIFHIVLIRQMTHGKICWLLYNSVHIYSVYSQSWIFLTCHTENFSLTIILTVSNINEILLETQSSVCGKTLSSSRCQMKFSSCLQLQPY